MPQVAKNAGLTWDTLAPAGRMSAGQAPRARVDGAGPSRPAGLRRSRHGTAHSIRHAQPDVATRVRRAWCAPPSSRWSAGIGFLIAYFYVADFFRQYAAALALAGFAAVTVFQSLGLYNMAALSAAHRYLPRVLMGWTATVALLLAGVFFLKVAPDFSRAWLALWYVSGAAALVAYRAGDRGPDAARPGRGPADAARHRVRHRARLREPAAGARRRSRQRHPRLRRVRRPRHRAGEPSDCRPCQPRQPRCADGLLPAHAGRHADRGAAGLGGDARAAADQEALGAAGRHPPRGAGLQAALPPAHLLLRRHRAADRRPRQADHRLGRRAQVAVRQERGLAGAAGPCPGHGAGGAGHQARQQGPGAVPPEALRLQQRADRGASSSARCSPTRPTPMRPSS